MNKIFMAFLAAAVLSAGCASRPAFTCTPLKNVTMPKGAVLIDVRTQKEYDERHIVGAVLIPRDKIRERIGAVAADRNTPIYLYCRSGRRADEARRELNGLGYRSVVNLCGIEAAEAALKK
jgi:phage shock protein E